MKFWKRQWSMKFESWPLCYCMKNISKRSDIKVPFYRSIYIGRKTVWKNDCSYSFRNRKDSLSSLFWCVRNLEKCDERYLRYSLVRKKNDQWVKLYFECFLSLKNKKLHCGVFQLKVFFVSWYNSLWTFHNSFTEEKSSFDSSRNTEAIWLQAFPL